MDFDEWSEIYCQMVYALDFDGKRLNGDKKNPATFPI